MGHMVLILQEHKVCKNINLPFRNGLVKGVGGKRNREIHKSIPSFFHY